MDRLNQISEKYVWICAWKNANSKLKVKIKLK